MPLIKSLGWRAENGDSDAQFEFALMYLRGDGLPQNRDLAINWIRQSAQGGNRLAQYYLARLARMYAAKPKDPLVPELVIQHLGQVIAIYNSSSDTDEDEKLWHARYGDVPRGNDPDSDEPAYTQYWIDYYEKAAAAGDVSSQFHYGHYLYRQHGDQQSGYDWYYKAAVQGHAKALDELGRMYSAGEYLPKDYVLGYVHHSLAYLAGIWDVMPWIRYMKSEMNRFQIDEAQQLTLQWKVGDPLPKRSATGQSTAGWDLESLLTEARKVHK